MNPIPPIKQEDARRETAIRGAIGGEYRLSDGRKFWIDDIAAREITRRVVGQDESLRKETDPINGLLHPFRKLPGEPAMSDAREDWRARRLITGRLSALGYRIDGCLDALHWDRRDPADGSEEDARRPLECLRAELCAFFGIPVPEFSPIQTAQPNHENHDQSGGSREETEG